MEYKVITPAEFKLQQEEASNVSSNLVLTKLCDYFNNQTQHFTPDKKNEFYGKLPFSSADLNIKWGYVREQFTHILNQNGWTLTSFANDHWNITFFWKETVKSNCTNLPYR